MSDQISDGTHDGSMGCATEWTPDQMLDFLTDPGAVRNDAYFDKRDRLRTLLTTQDALLAYAEALERALLEMLTCKRCPFFNRPVPQGPDAPRLPLCAVIAPSTACGSPECLTALVVYYGDKS